MIRKALKEHGIKASVRSRSASMMTAIDVTIQQDILPATRKEIEAYVGRFQYGHFDGMTDMYEYSNRDDDLPQVKYTSVRVEYSDELKAAVADYVEQKYADLSKWDRENIEYRTLIGSENAEFWTSRKARVAA